MKNKPARVSVFYKIFLYFLIPVVFITMVSIGTYMYYSRWFEKETIQAYLQGLTTVKHSIEEIFSEIYRNSVMLSSSRGIRYVMNSRSSVLKDKNLYIRECIAFLHTFRASKNIIHNAFVFHRPSDTVISTSGTFEAEFYFSNYHVFDDITYETWKNITIPGNDFVIMEPVLLRSGSKEIPVIRTIQEGLGEQLSRNLFVTEIKVSTLSKIMERFLFTPGSTIFLSDLQGNMYAYTGGEAEYGLLDSMLPEVQTFLASENQVDHITVNQEQILGIKVTPDPSFPYTPFIYSAFIPFSDIVKKSSIIRTSVLLIILIGLIVSGIIAYLMTKGVYKPIRGIVSTLSRMSEVSNNPTRPENEFDFMVRRIEEIISSQHRLTRNLSAAFPLAQEQCLLKILHKEDPAEKDVQSILNQQEGLFPNPDYCIAAVKISFSELFTKKFTGNEKSHLLNNLAKMSGTLFPADYTVYTLYPDTNLICLVLNVPIHINEDTIKTHIEKLDHFLSKDRELINISIGIGRITGNLAGIADSFEEARKALSQILYMSNERCLVYDAGRNKKGYEYSISEENKLINLLIAAEKEESEQFVQGIKHRNEEIGIADEHMRALLLHLYNTGIRVLTRQKKELSDVIESDDVLDITSLYEKLSTAQLEQYVSLLYTGIISHTTTRSRKVDPLEIVEYIKTHYTSEIYLDSIADRFGTSAKYLSQIIKSSLGVAFKDYLARLRINYAKEQLLKTKKTTDKIAEETGFGSKNSFYRVFKAVEGLSPTKYRILYKDRNSTSKKEF
jgi:two-component system, response regulator YesN